MFGLGFMIHFFIHVDLLRQRYLNAISFLFQLHESFLHKIIHGLELSQSVGSFFMFFEGGHLAIDHIVC